MEQGIAKVFGKDLPISMKHAVEISNFIRNKTTEQSKNILEKVIQKKLPVPFKKFKRNVAHKVGIAAGRYPKKAASEILKLIKAVEANAQNKGLIIPLTIKHISANKGPTIWHRGRQRRIKMKRTHIQIEVQEAPKKQEPKTSGNKQKTKSPKIKK